MALTDEQIANIVDNEFDEALGVPGGDISRDRGRAFDYYLSKLFTDDDEDADGASKVVTSAVSDVIDGIMPALLRIFTTVDNLVSFDPVGPEDEAGARQESDYVNYTFFKRNPAFELLFYWFFDALVQKNGYVKAWWDTSEKITTERYHGLTREEYDALLEDPELEEVESEQEVQEITLNDGPIQIVTHNVKFRRVTKQGRIAVDNVPPEELRISGDSRHLNPSNARMVGQERDVTRDELLSMGFPKKLVMELPVDQDTLDSDEKLARRDTSDERKQTQRESKDKSQDKIRLREAFIKIDREQNGRAELLQVFTADGKILEITEADRQPFHAICPHPLPHKHFGRATAEKVMDVQRIESELTRMILMNLYHTGNPGHAVWEQGIGENTMDDLMTTEVGSIKRFKRPVGESWQPITVPFTAGDTFPMLEWFDKIKRDRTGVNADSEGLSPSELKDVQRSVVSQMTDISKMKIEAIARIFAETGVKTLFLHIHELILKHQQKGEIVKLRGQWVPVNPGEWRTRQDMTVNIGLGIGTREQKLANIAQIQQTQALMVEGGYQNLTVEPKHIYNAASDMTEALMQQPNRYFRDPGDEKAPPPSDAQTELQRQQLAIQERQQELDARDQQIKMSKLQLDNEKNNLQHSREMLRLQEATEARLDKSSLENDKIRNQLMEVRGNLIQERVDAARAQGKSEAEIRKITAETHKLRAETVKIMEEADAVAMDTAATESGLTDLADAEESESE